MPDGKWIDLDVRQPGNAPHPRSPEANRGRGAWVPWTMPHSLRPNYPKRAAMVAACLSEDAMSLIMLGTIPVDHSCAERGCVSADDGDGFSNA